MSDKQRSTYVSRTCRLHASSAVLKVMTGASRLDRSAVNWQVPTSLICYVDVEIFPCMLGSTAGPSCCCMPYTLTPYLGTPSKKTNAILKSLLSSERKGFSLRLLTLPWYLSGIPKLVARTRNCQAESKFRPCSFLAPIVRSRYFSNGLTLRPSKSRLHCKFTS